MTPAQMTLLQTGVGVASQAGNAMFQASANRQTRQWNSDMYDLQRSHAIQDRNFNNFYNSPAEQMKRLKDANLNPNLAYASGGAITTASPIANTKMADYKPEAPRIDSRGIQEGLFAGVDLEIKQAQTDNLKAAVKTAELDQAVKAAQVSNITADTISKGVNTSAARLALDTASRLQQTTIDRATSELDKIKVDTAIALQENERRTALTANTLAQGLEAILTSRVNRAKTEQETINLQQALRNMKSDNTLKQFEIKLNQQGITKNDPAYLRVIGGIVNDITNGKPLPQVIGNQLNKLDNAISGGNIKWNDRTAFKRAKEQMKK